MNKELLASMREQMRPSEEARAALEEKLAAPWKKRVPAGRYAAIAACLAAVIAAAPAYNFIRDSLEIGIDPGPGDRRTEITEPHSYVLADELGISSNVLTNVYFICMDNVNTLWEQLTNPYLSDTGEEMEEKATAPEGTLQ